MIRRFGEPVVHGQRYVRRPGVYAVLKDGDSVLLTHQAEPVPEYQLPGGGIDRGEQPLAALHREVYEETGWSIRVERRLGAFRRFTFMPEYQIWAEKLCTVYLACPIRRLGPPTEPMHTPIWATLAVAPALLANSGDRHFLSSVAQAQAR